MGDPQYPGIDGILGTRASIMLDVVFLAMFAVIPVMVWSIYQAKYRRKLALHKSVQLALGGVLLVAVSAFEIDMRWISGWQPRAAGLDGTIAPRVFISLWIHLFFAVTTAVLWIFVIVMALRKFPKPPRPNEYSGKHIFWARLAAIDMFLTALTGWVFYVLAFVL